MRPPLPPTGRVPIGTPRWSSATRGRKEVEAGTPQRTIYAMRTTRAVPLAEITRRTGLSVDEVRRFNPALVQQVPARANLYPPHYVPDFGPDVSSGTDRHPMITLPR